MLSYKILSRKDLEQAASYYEDSKDDYYTKDGKASSWQGKGAKISGLCGAVARSKFKKLLAGEVERGFKARTSTRKSNKDRIGIDLTFSAPKSVSMQALIAKDARVVKAHDKAVKRTLKMIEKSAQARQKIKGKTYVEKTNNLIVATFRHETSREQDPQLHTHAVVMNLTQRKDGQWRALKNDEIIKANRYFGIVYQAELALELQKSGYSIRIEKGGTFELDHITREQIEGFSKRSGQIEENLRYQGLTRQTATKKQKQRANLKTRKHKTATSHDIIFDKWQDRAKELGVDLAIPSISDKQSLIGSRNKNKDKTKAKELRIQDDMLKKDSAKRALQFAVNHLTERQSIMGEGKLLDKALEHVVGTARLSDIEEELKKQIKNGYLIKDALRYSYENDIKLTEAKTRDEWIRKLSNDGMNKTQSRNYVARAIRGGSLIKLEPRYTTPTALLQEQYILHSEKSGRRSLEAITTAETAKEQLAKSKLNLGQLEAATLIATTENRIVGVQGFAGTGKSHMLKATKKVIEDAGYNIRALAPYGAQVKALKELGVEGSTLASFLRSKDKNINERTVIVIDEAGVVPTRLLEQTIKLVEKSGARIILIGDTAQTKAIEAGRPFDQLQNSGMATAKMDEIQRQENKTLKEAVKFAAKGQVAESLKHIDNIMEIKDDKIRQASIAKDYIELSKTERDKTIIVTGTNEARRDINAEIRRGLRLEGKGREIDTLINRDITREEKKHAIHYNIGEIVKPEKDYKKSGLKQGDLYTVKNINTERNRLTVTDESGKSIEFSPLFNQKLSIYKQEKIEVSVGDVVRIRRSDRNLSLVNGDILKAEKIEGDYITFSSRKRQINFSIDKPVHLDHAYASTVHSSQGLTSDRVLIDADTKSPTTARDVYYVAISRARKEARVYTDSLEKLPGAISRESKKFAALEIKSQKTRQFTGSDKSRVIVERHHEMSR